MTRNKEMRENKQRTISSSLTAKHESKQFMEQDVCIHIYLEYLHSFKKKRKTAMVIISRAEKRRKTKKVKVQVSNIPIAKLTTMLRKTSHHREKVKNMPINPHILDTDQ